MLIHQIIKFHTQISLFLKTSMYRIYHSRYSSETDPNVELVSKVGSYCSKLSFSVMDQKWILHLHSSSLCIFSWWKHQGKLTAVQKMHRHSWSVVILSKDCSHRQSLQVTRGARARSPGIGFSAVMVRQCSLPTEPISLLSLFSLLNPCRKVQSRKYSSHWYN